MNGTRSLCGWAASPPSRGRGSRRPSRGSWRWRIPRWGAAHHTHCLPLAYTFPSGRFTPRDSHWYGQASESAHIGVHTQRRAHASVAHLVMWSRGRNLQLLRRTLRLMHCTGSGEGHWVRVFQHPAHTAGVWHRGSGPRGSHGGRQRPSGALRAERCHRLGADPGVQFVRATTWPVPVAAHVARGLAAQHEQRTGGLRVMHAKM